MNSRYRTRLAWCVGILFSVASASASTVNADPVPVWGRWEGSFSAAESVDAAQELQLKVALVSPDGQTQRIEGFWDGGREWKARFMPDQPGTWRYRTRAEPPVPGLDGQEGRFEVKEADGEGLNRFLEHGAVQVSQNARYLEHADGTPFFWVADTAWNGALKSTADDWQTYLQDRRGKGFTAIQFVTTQWRAAPADRQGQTAYEGYEKITIHPEFFQRLDQRVDSINDAGLLAAPVMLWALGQQDEVPGKLPEDQAIRLARYIKARYGAHHVAWFLAGDEDFSGERGDRWKRIGRAVFDGSPHDALATLHPQGRQWHFEQYADEDWLDLIIYQSSHGGGPQTLSWIHSGPPSERWREEPVRPIINSEPGYEDHIAWERGERHTAFDVRQQAYYSLLVSPPAGISYGGHGIWSWETEPAEPLNHRGSGVAKPWHQAMHLPGSEDIGHLADLFTDIEWWTLRPAPELLVNQPGGDDPTRFVPAARSQSGDLAMVYLPQGGEVQVQMEELASGVTAEWFNPRAGSRQPAEPDGSGTFSTPDDKDWVLVLSRTSITDWTGWRGPQRDGWVQGFEPPAQWPADLQRRWQTDVGTGYGTPLFADGSVYLHTRQDGHEVVRCLELETGKVRWRQSYPVPFQIGSGAERHGKGPKSSPALADGRLFTLSITGALSAWDAATGELRWRRDYDSQFEKSHPYWGAAASPLVDGDRVIVHFGTDDQGVLAALDVETGEEVWTLGDDGPSYSSPLLAELHGVRQVVQWNRRAVIGVNSRTGHKLWEYAFPQTGGNQNMPTPVIHHGRILLGGENRGMYCLDPQRTGGEWSVEEVWYQNKIALDMSSAVINDGLLFGFSHYASGQFFCLDPASGDVLWQGPPRTGENVMFLAIPEHVLALINNGELKVIAADGDAYQPVASYRVADGGTWASPVLTPCGVLIKDERTLSLWGSEGVAKKRAR